MRNVDWSSPRRGVFGACQVEYAPLGGPTRLGCSYVCTPIRNDWLLVVLTALGFGVRLNPGPARTHAMRWCRYTRKVSIGQLNKGSSRKPVIALFTIWLLHPCMAQHKSRGRKRIGWVAPQIEIRSKRSFSSRYGLLT